MRAAMSDAPPDTPRNRRVLYGRRIGHPLRDRAKALLTEHLPRLSISAESPLGDLAALFPHRPHDIWLEIGAGGGEHAAAIAAANPKIGLIAAEPFINGLAKLIVQAEAAGLTNLRLFPDDARTLIAALPEASLARVYLLYPDPWPKRRHWKRRFISERMVSELARIMRPGGELRLATDAMDYAAWSLFHLRADPRWRWRARGPADWREPWAHWPGTRYEAKAKRAGRPCVYLTFERL